MISRASLTASQIRTHRMLGTSKRRGRMPRQIHPMRLENSYSKALVSYVTHHVDRAFAQFRSEIPYLLNANAADARMDGLRLDVGEGKRIRELIDQARKQMRDTIVTPELERLAHDFAQQTQVYQRQQLARQAKAALGVDPFIADRRLQALMAAFVDTNVGLIKGLTDDVATKVEKSALLAVQDAKTYESYADELQEKLGISDSRAELIARDQIGKFYGQANASRQRELGVTSFIWRTSHDERVRDEHEVLDGETFAYDDPPDEGLPGEAIQCRCVAEPDFSGILDKVSGSGEDD